MSEDLRRPAGGHRRQGLLYGARHSLRAPGYLVLGGHRGRPAGGRPLPHRLGRPARQPERPPRIRQVRLLVAQQVTTGGGGGIVHLMGLIRLVGLVG